MMTTREPSAAPPAVELVPITRDNWREAIALRVRRDQQEFVPAVAVSLAKVSIQPDGPDEEYRSYGVFARDRMVGFGQLVGQFGVSSTLWIGGFLIDRRFQRRGYGRSALRVLIELARLEPGCSEVGLTVEPHNSVAKLLYASEGFVATGQIYDDELVFRLPLALAAP